MLKHRLNRETPDKTVNLFLMEWKRSRECAQLSYNLVNSISIGYFQPIEQKYKFTTLGIDLHKVRKVVLIRKVD